MKLVEQMHLHGISQRKISDLAKSCFGVKLSKNRVGSIYKELVEAEDVALNQQPLTDDYDYLILDGIWETTKGFGWDDKRSVIICALGYNSKTNSAKILGFHFSRTEDTSSIKVLLHNLKSREFLGKNLQLVIADDNPAFPSAIEVSYPGLPIQNCIAHKMRNVIAKTSHKNKAQIATDLKSIFDESNRE
jgi:transposase-like protein